MRGGGAGMVMLWLCGSQGRGGVGRGQEADGQTCNRRSQGRAWKLWALTATDAAATPPTRHVIIRRQPFRLPSRSPFCTQHDACGHSHTRSQIATDPIPDLCVHTCVGRE